jgi:polyisoprenoid-binding protein YceI
VSIQAGRYRLGRDNATLSVRTKRAGAAAKAGHDLVIRVTSWEAELVIAEDPAYTSMELTADATSLRVVKGTGGMQALRDDDVEKIEQTINDKVLMRQDIRFRSTRVQTDPGGGSMHAEGDLTLVGSTQPIAFDLAVDDAGALSATALVTQTAWDMKPYSGLFGALKVKDDVEVVLEGQLDAGESP